MLRTFFNVTGSSQSPQTSFGLTKVEMDREPYNDCREKVSSKYVHLASVVHVLKRARTFNGNMHQMSV